MPQKKKKKEKGFTNVANGRNLFCRISPDQQRHEITRSISTVTSYLHRKRNGKQTASSNTSATPIVEPATALQDLSKHRPRASGLIQGTNNYTTSSHCAGKLGCSALMPLAARVTNTRRTHREMTTSWTIPREVANTGRTSQAVGKKTSQQKRNKKINE